MYIISKEFHFSASHRLEHLPDEHQCSRLHGHNYIVVVELESRELHMPVGFVFDYGDLKPFKEYLDAEIDHRHLNDIFDFNTSAENLASHFFQWCKLRWSQTSAVRVSETPKTWAEYSE